MNFDGEGPVPHVDLVERWPHQLRAVEGVFNCLDRGVQRVLVTTPTGGGKTLAMADIVRQSIRRNWGVILFTNRKLLFEQMKKSLTGYGLSFGMRAANHFPDHHERFQIASIQTEYSRVCKRLKWDTHECDIMIIDEAHLNENPKAAVVYNEYQKRGVRKVGFTATPIGIGGGYDELVIAGTTSELRACGALVPAIHFGCTEPDLRNIKRFKVGEEVTETMDRKAIMVPGIHGRVIEHFRRLNPTGLPSIGFAPGVPESVGFAEAFEDAGIPAAHIDGERLWIRGEEVHSNEARRNELLELSKRGVVRIIWNRFVLREAVDMPWLRHGIFATLFGSLQSYLQSGGRLLRAFPGKDSVSIQDHGGNWWRHGSLNSDRRWRLDGTARMLENERVDAITGDGNDGTPTEPEPFRCNGCNMILVLRTIMNAEGTKATCPGCGHVMDFRRRSRPVLQANGELVEHTGAVFNPKRVELRSDTHKKWRDMYWRAKRSKTMTFAQAAGLFCVDNGYFPPRSLPLMPTTAWQWYLPVSKVPFHDLRPENS